MALFPFSLPAFPWDGLELYRARAAAHPGGAIILTVGTPVDPTPPIIRAALSAAADAPGYPTTHGTDALREAIVAWFEGRGVRGLSPVAVLPTIGSKEFIGGLPGLLGLGVGDVIVQPRVAYPTYMVGATLVGATTLATDDVSSWEKRSDVRLVWVNSPSNPTGRVLGRKALAEVVEAARGIGAVVVSDECYAEYPWEEPWTSEGVPSVLDDVVCGGRHDGVLAVSSLSKRSNLAGYRAAFVAGDQGLVGKLLETRKHLGLMMPTPVQEAATVALGDRAHVEAQREVYGRRRAMHIPALASAGFTVDHSEAGLYLWVTRGEACWDTVAWFAELGIVVAPGVCYGPDGGSHVRIALTATDTYVDAAARRLTDPG
ncbi:MAG: succinyldiaminopimelate transaminase [Demequinaceae bacterium]|nr:succinyldiaminopimelate transaminase [Demequinaceae bacterium]